MKTVGKCVTLIILSIVACSCYFIITLLQVDDNVVRRTLDSKDATNQYVPGRDNNLCNSSSSRKYVIGLSYWEQLNMAVRNMFQLVIVANDWGSRVVEPYTINSRLFGLRNFVIKRETAITYSDVPLSLRELVDTDKLNGIICSNGLPHLASVQEFTDKSAELVIVVHFIHHRDNPNDLNVPANVKAHITTQFSSSPVVDCTTLLEHYLYRIGNLLQQETDGKRDHVIKHYYCVDATKLISTEKLAKMIGIADLAEFTVIVVDWHGYSSKSMVYNSAQGPHMNKRATLNTSYKGPSFAAVTLPHSQRVINATERYLQYSKITIPFIAVHIRSEKIGHVQSTHKGYVSSCMNKMIDMIEQLKKQHDISNVVICTDAGEAGSDSCANCRGRSETLQILHEHHLKITHFNPNMIGEIHDNGLIALVEMNILSHGDHLIVVGGGSFQNQTEQNFIHYHSISYNNRIYEVCTRW